MDWVSEDQMNRIRHNEQEHTQKLPKRIYMHSQQQRCSVQHTGAIVQFTVIIRLLNIHKYNFNSFFNAVFIIIHA